MKNLGTFGTSGTLPVKSIGYTVPKFFLLAHVAHFMGSVPNVPNVPNVPRFPNTV